MSTRAILLLVTALAATAQSPVFQSDIRVVEVAVVARDAHDLPVTDLRKGDFRLFDNGVQQTIGSFERLATGGKPGGAATDAQSASFSARAVGVPRLSIIVLDALNSPPATQVNGRRAIVEMLRNLPQGLDRIAIFALGDQLHLLHGFSLNTASLRAAVEGYAGELTAMGVPSSTPFAGAFSLGAAVHREVTADPYTDLRLAGTLGALAEIARNMKDVPGEKNLLWVTAGFPPPEEHQGIEAAMRQLTAARVTLYPIDARGLISCIGPCPPEVNLNIASMEELAEQTGGRAYHDGNDLAAMALSAIDDSREGYTLTYTPVPYRQDGSDHKVQLRTTRKNIDLRYRPGYFAD